MTCQLSSSVANDTYLKRSSRTREGGVDPAGFEITATSSLRLFRDRQQGPTRVAGDTTRRASQGSSAPLPRLLHKNTYCGILT
ncbi:hypothetical protein CMUS01_14454 [Colletotrichum musicola]|uniref:Uncharacterized protein n=1 Tax=Colletotrichum musicola TaxID=2175873 RepID=A0A8H6J3Z3_9PEZI|nr:hypothetical protein CMUS01_14454 [Colletotrichum musicola]